MGELLPQVQQGRADLVTASVASPPSASSPKLTPQQQVAMQKATREGNIVRSLAFPAAMASSVPMGKEVGASGFKLFLDGLTKDAGVTTDPVERMLVEQLALAHHRVAQLHAQAEQATEADLVKVYLTAAIRLTGELRRLALALRQYRDPAPKRSFTVVRQQNLVGQQQVAYVAQARPSEQIPFSPGGELTSRRLSHAPSTSFIPESAASGSRQTEPALARPADTGRTRAATASCEEEPAMDVCHRPENAAGQGPLGS